MYRGLVINPLGYCSGVTSKCQSAHLKTCTQTHKNAKIFCSRMRIFIFYSQCVRPYLPVPALGCQWQLALISTPSRQAALTGSFFPIPQTRSQTQINLSLIASINVGMTHSCAFKHAHRQRKMHPALKSLHKKRDNTVCWKCKKPLGKLDSLVSVHCINQMTENQCVKEYSHRHAFQW